MYLVVLVLGIVFLGVIVFVVVECLDWVGFDFLLG